MEYLLMHKDIKVMRFTLDEGYDIKNIVKMYRPEHMPFSTENVTNESLFLLKEWWKDRAIPETRDGYKELFDELKGETSLSLMVKTRCLSLTDQYWIKGVKENVNYDDVSFFVNGFPSDIGDMFLGNEKEGKISFYSPDSTTIGNLKKRWKIIGGKRYLFKTGSFPNQYEVFNELVASKIMNILDIEHVDYTIDFDEKNIFCKSVNFVDYNEDFVSAYQLYESKKRRNDVSYYDHIMKIGKELGIPDFKLKINQMLFVDYLIGNIDRHLMNFGVIRDAKTLQFTRVSPIFDCGSSLGFNLKDEQFNNLNEVEWMPFKSKSHKDQLSLIKDFSWLNINALQTIPSQVDQLLVLYGDYLSKERRRAIVNFLIRRINNVYQYLNINKKASLQMVNINVLEEDILFYAYKNGSKLTDLYAIAKEYRVAYITVYRAVASLTNKGLLIRRGARKNGYWILP